MSESKPLPEPTPKQPETKLKKMVSRNVALALGIICIVLMAGLTGTILSFNDKVNDLNSIVNFQKTVTWLSNKTYIVNPNENVSELFYAPYSGDVRIVANWQPPNPNVWFNLTYGVRFGFTTWIHYYSEPYFDTRLNSYVGEEFPVVSFGQGIPNVAITIENNSPDTVTTVNLTITFQY